jgi:hypothetical protein
VLMPKLKPLPRKDLWRLLEDYRIIAQGVTVVVPIAFEFDGASVPWFGWQATYTPASPKVIAAALAHDWLYLNHQTEKPVADKIFREILLRCGADPERSWIMYQAVAVAGGSAWEHSDEDVEVLRRLYRIIRRRENFEEYCFPMDLIEEV